MWGQSQEPVTRGIQMWEQPFIIPDKDGKQVTLKLKHLAFVLLPYICTHMPALMHEHVNAYACMCSYAHTHMWCTYAHERMCTTCGHVHACATCTAFNRMITKAKLSPYHVFWVVHCYLPIWRHMLEVLPCLLLTLTL